MADRIKNGAKPTKAGNGARKSKPIGKVGKVGKEVEDYSRYIMTCLGKRYDKKCKIPQYFDRYLPIDIFDNIIYNISN
jgi:hypothetical protein